LSPPLVPSSLEPAARAVAETGSSFVATTFRSFVLLRENTLHVFPRLGNVPASARAQLLIGLSPFQIIVQNDLSVEKPLVLCGIASLGVPLINTDGFPDVFFVVRPPTMPLRRRKCSPSLSLGVRSAVLPRLSLAPSISFEVQSLPTFNGPQSPFFLD